MVLRIAFDIAALSRGGAERETLEVASGLSDLGHDVLLIVNKRVEHFAEYIDRVQIVELGHDNRWDVRVLPDIRRTLRGLQGGRVRLCDVQCLSVGRLAAASLGCRVFIAEHSTSGNIRLVERRANILLCAATERVIACADAQVGPWCSEATKEAEDTRCSQRRGHQEVRPGQRCSDRGAVPIWIYRRTTRLVMLVAAHRRGEAS